MKNNFIRFDWAAKRLLRQKSNFVILEGLLSTLLKEDIHIVRMLESESNKEEVSDKFNRVDMLAQNSDGELIIIEVQNTREPDYFHRMLYGVSKAITEYIQEGDEYETVRKLYSINIVYFGLGQGDDYIYYGSTKFVGLYKNDVLKLSKHQQEQFTYQDAGDLFPEYYVLRVNKFDKKVVTSLDEWMLFLKTGDIPENVTAKGLSEARELLRIDRMNQAERSAYNAHTEALRYQKSVIQTGLIEGRMEGLTEGRAEGLAEGLEKGRAEGLEKGLARGLAKGLEKGRAEGLAEGLEKGAEKMLEDIILTSSNTGLSIEAIARITGFTAGKISKILKQHSKITT
ncbi:MAG: PD-(D/E)XK nuclease family transposase [Prevotellaceae bacterium]|jgi:predicted transposase/invertase (TIGR01784 family)|nr:PD-(D/E)XK nuclease family transposase [Prevotellaceae bacterium]